MNAPSAINNTPIADRQMLVLLSICMVLPVIDTFISSALFAGIVVVVYIFTKLLLKAFDRWILDTLLFVSTLVVAAGFCALCAQFCAAYFPAINDQLSWYVYLIPALILLIDFGSGSVDVKSAKLYKWQSAGILLFWILMICLVGAISRAIALNLSDSQDSLQIICTQRCFQLFRNDPCFG